MSEHCCEDQSISAYRDGDISYLNQFNLRCLAPAGGSVVCGTEGGNAKKKKKKGLYLEELAWVQRRPAAPQTELTDVAVTDISLLTLPHARPYEYLRSGEEPAVMQFFYN